ncbi:helix-turn-helix domain-containing protein [Erythrobacter litoralis]|uniref:HTH cro/C1-type domain-containing protein n=1 Tax=Erythrobacter litoralis (strain HTCC2594) TaxID=314225 RepID=Q2NDP8_ERYLH|nr:helix-turn-helix domain-containing protein [Erythrobacter litoralis]ABC62193.1 hypothetical protein ELI_00505 [Erythrobacter litoralis HTCC2594]
MADNEVTEGTAELSFGAGERLRAERERQDLTLEQIAAKTRIPKRHIESIEASDFTALPAAPYAVGFSKTYAKVLGLDPEEIAEQVRTDLGAEDPAERYGQASGLEPGDPARVPSRGLVFFSIAAIVLLLAGGFMFYRTFFLPGAGPGSILTAEQQAQAEARADAQEAAAEAAPAAEPGGPVVFTALMDDTWVKFYDGSGRQLMQKQMAEGESYTVPADAQNPQIWTGRPYAFSISIGGQTVPKLSEEDRVLKDVPVSAEALLARADEPSETAEPEA